MLKVLSQLLQRVVLGSGKAPLVVRREKRRLFSSRKRYEYHPMRRIFGLLLGLGLTLL